MKICENGVYREMTEDEIREFQSEFSEIPSDQSSVGDALTQMARAMSQATTIAQMRSAAKKFLSQTETEVLE